MLRVLSLGDRELGQRLRRGGLARSGANRLRLAEAAVLVRAQVRHAPLPRGVEAGERLVDPKRCPLDLVLELDQVEHVGLPRADRRPRRAWLHDVQRDAGDRVPLVAPDRAGAVEHQLRIVLWRDHNPLAVLEVDDVQPRGVLLIDHRVAGPVDFRVQVRHVELLLDLHQAVPAVAGERPDVVEVGLDRVDHLFGDGELCGAVLLAGVLHDRRLDIDDGAQPLDGVVAARQAERAKFMRRGAFCSEDAAAVGEPDLHADGAATRHPTM